MYRFKTLTAAVAVATARRSLRLNPALPTISRTYASRYAAKKGKIRDGANLRKVLPPHLQSDNVRVICLRWHMRCIFGRNPSWIPGTDQESKREVEKIIHFLKPEVVFLERCSSMFKEEKRLTGGFDPHSVRVKLVAKDKLEVALKRVGEEEGYTITINGFKADWNPLHDPDLAYDTADCEFLVPYLLAIIYDRKVILGDRPIKITERRLESATFWDFIKCLYYTKFSNESPSHKLARREADIESTTRLLKASSVFITIEIQSKSWEKFIKVMIDERDQYMSVKLLEAARQHSSVVAVVGRAHLEGIQKNWKQPVDLEQLLVMPRDPWIVAHCVLAAVLTGAFQGIYSIIMHFAY